MEEMDTPGVRISHSKTITRDLCHINYKIVPALTILIPTLTLLIYNMKTLRNH